MYGADGFRATPILQAVLDVAQDAEQLVDLFFSSESILWEPGFLSLLVDDPDGESILAMAKRHGLFELTGRAFDAGYGDALQRAKVKSFLYLDLGVLKLKDQELSAIYRGLDLHLEVIGRARRADERAKEHVSLQRRTALALG